MAAAFSPTHDPLFRHSRSRDGAVRWGSGPQSRAESTLDIWRVSEALTQSVDCPGPVSLLPLLSVTCVRGQGRRREAWSRRAGPSRAFPTRTLLGTALGLSVTGTPSF